MNLPTKAHGHTLHSAPLNQLVELLSMVAYFVASLVALLHLLQLVTTTCTRMRQRR
jgi:hypothetical protein